MNQKYFVQYYKKVTIVDEKNDVMGVEPHIIELERFCFDLDYDGVQTLIRSRVEGETDYIVGQMEDFDSYTDWAYRK